MPYHPRGLVQRENNTQTHTYTHTDTHTNGAYKIVKSTILRCKNCLAIKARIQKQAHIGQVTMLKLLYVCIN